MNRQSIPLVSLPPARKPDPTHPGYQPAGSHDRPDLRLHELIQLAVLRHVAHHVVPRLAANRPPRFLVIQGNPGEGKTETVRVTCSRSDIDCILVSGAELAGETENAGVAALEQIGRAALAISDREKRPLVILLDDFDLSSVARLDRTEYTVSSQLLTGHLQFIADTGALRTAAGVPIPLIMTGNDFTAVRTSLLRPGRATHVEHQPTFDQKCDIIGTMLNCRDARAVRGLVKAYRDQPVAFFAQLKVLAADAALDQLIRTHGFNPSAIDAALPDTSPVDIARLHDLAAQTVTRPTSYLTRR